MTYSIPPASTGTGINAPVPLAQSDRLTHLAHAFEAAMLTELLQAAGAGQTASAFGGGAGEEQFASFLLRAQAELIAERGGIGLAEMAMRAMMSAPAPDAPA